MLSSWWRKLMMTRMCRAAGRGRRPVRLGFEGLEDRTTPAGIFAVGSAPGAAASVTVFDAATRAQKFTISPYPGFTGGVNVAVGDVNGDGTPDVITGAGVGGGPVVNVYSGTDGTLLKTFTVGDASSRSGATVAAADYDGDGLADLVIGSMRNGQPLVQVLRFSDGTVLHGYAPFTGGNGVSVAAGDVNGDGTPDTIVGAGSGGGPHVTVFDGKTDAQLYNFFAFEKSFTGGVHVSAGDLNGDGRADIITTAAFTGGPRVEAFSGQTGAVLLNFFAYSADLRDGVWATAADVDGNGTIDLVTASGVNQTNLKAFDPRTLAALSTPLPPGLPATTAWDTTAPTVTLSTTAPDPTKTAPIPFTAAFSEAVDGFAATDLAVTNGTAGDFTRVDAKTYTFSVTPTADGTVSVSIPAGAATDAAGNASAAAAAVSRTFDSTPPTVSANTLTTNNPKPTLTGTVSESDATVSVSVGGQTFPATVSGTTWTATVPSALTEGTYTIDSTATDAVGNTGTGSSPNGLVVDLTAPDTALTGPASETYTDKATSTAKWPDSITGTATDGGPSGLKRVEVRIVRASDNAEWNGTTFVPAPASPIFTPATGTSSWSFAFPVANFPTDGAYNVTVRAVDNAGNVDASPASASYTIDRTVLAPSTPDLDPASDTGVSNSDNITTDTTPTFTGTGEAKAIVTLFADSGSGATAVGTGTVQDDGTWSITVTNPLAGGTTYQFTATQTDAVGNGPSAASGNLGVTIDTTAPTVAGVNSTTANGAYTTGATITIQVTFSDAVFVTGGTPTLALNSGLNASATYASGSGTPVLTFTYTVAAGDTAADLDAFSPGALSLNGATIQDTAGNNADLTVPTGNAPGSLAANKDIVIDTTAPTGSVDPVTTGGAITGTADGTGSAVTKVQVKVTDGSGNFWDPNTQTFTATDPGFTDAAVTPGTGSSATWSFAFPAGPGTYTAEVQVTDAATNVGTTSGTVTV